MSDVIDYGAIADLYDIYVDVDFDLEFFRRQVAACAGPVLELTAGTGRVSRAIQAVVPQLTCLDVSREMLIRLKRALTGSTALPYVVCADMRALPLADRYALALIPFNAFAELTNAADQRDALRELHRVLTPGGQLVCTLHNPRVRVASLDGRAHRLGSYDLVAAERLDVWFQGSVTATNGLVTGVQTYRTYDACGALKTTQVLDVRFVLIEHDVFNGLASDSGFEVSQVFGNYDESAYEPETSPYMIWMLQRP